MSVLSGIQDSDTPSGSIAQKIRVFASKRGMSISALSADTGISRSHLYAAFNGETSLSFDHVVACSVSLNFDITRLQQMDIAYLANLAPGGLDAEMLTIGVTGTPDLKAEIVDQAKQLVQSVWDTAFNKLAPQSDSPTIDHLTTWWEQHNGRLENYDALKPYIGKYWADQDGALKLKAEDIGHECLAAKRLWTTDPDKISHYMNSLDKKTREEIIYSYVTPQKKNSYSLERRHLVVDVPELDQAYAITYRTLLLPMTSGCVVNFSEFVSSTPVLIPKQEVLGIPNSTRQAVQAQRG